MSGSVFIILIPNEEQEKLLIKNLKKHVTIDEKAKIIPVSSSNNHLLSDQFYGYNYRSCNVLGANINKDFKNYECMEQVVRNVLERLDITNATWSKTNDQYHQVMFPVECAEKCEEILESLQENNIGTKFNSIVSVIPCSINYYGMDGKKKKTRSRDTIRVDGNESDNELNVKKEDSGWNLFLASVRARLTVAQVAHNVKSHAIMTFDFVFLLLLSSLLCAIGFVENNSITMVSSMLISPMMGPVLAGTFGSVIRDKYLQKVGVRNELIGLGIATLVGFCYGAVICIITDKYINPDWPTYQMLSGGELRSLWVGAEIALLAGAAVVVGILSDNTTSLVGVAISASLMPPAVNAGLLWSLATIYYFKAGSYDSLTQTQLYSTNRALELLSLGAVSMCLTFVNIVCIYFAGIIVFKIKEVALPSMIRDQAKRRFFQNDIKIARDYNRTFPNMDENNIIINLPKEFARYRRSESLKNDLHHLGGEEDIRSHMRHFQNTWSPCMVGINKTNSENKARRLSQMYNNIMHRSDGLSINNSTGGSKKLSPVINNTRRNLTQIFVRDDGRTGMQETLPIFSANSYQSISTASRKVFSGSKIFTVTPSETDPLIKK